MSEDRTTSEMLKLGGDTLLQSLKVFYNKGLEEGKIPTDWQNAEVILSFKKGDNTDIKNYRPISLLLHLYKLLATITTNRLFVELDFYQPIEQAGFRKGFSTLDHFQAMKLLIEKTRI